MPVPDRRRPWLGVCGVSVNEFAFGLTADASASVDERDGGPLALLVSVEILAPALDQILPSPNRPGQLSEGALLQPQRLQAPVPTARFISRRAGVSAPPELSVYTAPHQRNRSRKDLSFGMAKEVPLAEADPAPGRRWNPQDIADSCVVDTVGIGLLTVGQDDSDGRAP